MKLKIPLLAVLIAGVPCVSSAFTLDAVGYGGSELSSNPVSVFVPGYGQLTFEALNGSALPVSSAFLNDNGSGGPSLNFDQNEAIRVTFNGAEPLNVNFDFVGVSVGENFVIQKDSFTPQAYILSLQGAGEGADGAGLYAISWNTKPVPEPASAMLGLIGASVFAFRRRR